MNVILLTDRFVLFSQHIPYRNHPLTMLMSDSIGGNAKTLMFVNTSPADYNSAESNSSLAFASRCKDVTNQVASAPGVQAAQVRFISPHNYFLSDL